MWLHFNKFDEYTGFSLPVWALTPLFVVFLILVMLLWPIAALGMSLDCFNKGRNICGWLFLFTIPIWFMKLFGVI